MYNPDDYTRGMNAEALTVNRAVNKVLVNVYGWMAGALALTALVAWFVSNTNYWQMAIENQMLLWVPLIAELGIVFYMGMRLQQMAFRTMAVLMAVYSAINGLTMSSLLLVYTAESVASTFAVCSAMFGTMCFLGHTTKTDMTAWGKYFMMAIIGLIVASIVNIFLGNSMLAMGISYLGVLLFVGLTAYDAQKIRVMVEQNYYNRTLDMNKLALWGSLSLYLDFVNLFIYLLRIMGNRRN